MDTRPDLRVEPRNDLHVAVDTKDLKSSGEDPYCFFGDEARHLIHTLTEMCELNDKDQTNMQR